MTKPNMGSINFRNINILGGKLDEKKVKTTVPIRNTCCTPIEQDCEPQCLKPRLQFGK